MIKSFIQKCSSILVSRRTLIGSVVLVLTVLCACLIPFVPIHTDMTQYLPADSNMKQGIDLLAQDFPEMENPSTVRVMFTGLSEAEKDAVLDQLSAIEFVDSISYNALDPRCEDGTHSLYTLSTSFGYKTSEMNSIRSALKKDFHSYNMVFSVDDPGGELPMWIVALAIVIVVAILLVMGHSWVEPFLTLIVVGAAIAINSGISYFSGGMSDTTWSVAAILQLILSLDYSVILQNRYRQEKQRDPSCPIEKAMTHALVNAFSAIASSSLTTVAGLLALVFMSFRIGKDMGFVLARGVLCSMLCIFTLLPMLLLSFDKLISRSVKKTPQPDLSKLARFQYRFRYPVLAVLVILFAAGYLLKSSAGISFAFNSTAAIDKVFPPLNPVIVLYSNEDEEALAVRARALEEDPDVYSVNAWSTTIGRSFTSREMKEMLPTIASSMGVAVPEAAVDLMYLGKSADETISVPELISMAQNLLEGNPLFKSLLSDEIQDLLLDAQNLLADGQKMLRGEHYSLMQVNTTLPLDSEQTFAFIDRVNDDLTQELSSPFYLIGNSAMGWEMSKTFRNELNRITLLTAGAVFIVVLFTFKSLVIPAVLVLLIQTAVYATMIIIHLQGFSIYYLALLVVQSILMGATIDYGILFTSYYREMRSTLQPPEALKRSYTHSINTILTSGSIMIVATLILGYAFSNPAIGQICHTIAKGAACAVVLILLILPGALAALDRFVSNKGRFSV